MKIISSSALRRSSEGSRCDLVEVTLRNDLAPRSLPLARWRQRDQAAFGVLNVAPFAVPAGGSTACLPRAGAGEGIRTLDIFLGNNEHGLHLRPLVSVVVPPTDPPCPSVRAVGCCRPSRVAVRVAVSRPTESRRPRPLDVGCRELHAHRS